MSFIDRIKGLFKRKVKEGKDEKPSEQSEVPMPQMPVQQKNEQVPTKPVQKKPQYGTPERPEKICPKCGSPNDVFVSICWLCKSEI